MIDIKRMAREEQISEQTLRTLLGIPSNSPSTLKQAREAYENAPGWSEEKRLAMAKWRELSAKAVAEATTLEQAREAYRNAPSGSEEERLAILKLAEFYHA